MAASYGTGCALVFDYDAVFAGAHGGKRYALFPVLYDPEIQTRLIEQTFDHAIHLERDLEVSGRRHRERYWTEVEFALMACAVRFKDPARSREQEVRLWVSSGPDVKAFEAFGKPRVNVEFEAASLKRVIRGPASDGNLSVDKIEKLLGQHDFENVSVTQAGT